MSGFRAIGQALSYLLPIFDAQIQVMEAIPWDGLTVRSR